MCMIIMQMFPVAVTCGNTFILKPSEKDPGNFFTYCGCLPGLNSVSWSLMLNKMDKGYNGLCNSKQTYAPLLYY